MPSLNWIGKDKITNHDKDVPFRLMKKNQKLSLGKSENLILEGDNLEALKALMPFYYNKVKCVYIDPPYNTGNEKWIYNDKVNSPKIKEWLGKVVGPEGDDLTRHDKWLCMMYPRLKLLYDLLSLDGGIFVSIDYNEDYHLRILLNEIFGADNYRNTFAVSRVKKNIQEREKVKALNFGYNSVIFYAKSDQCLVVPPRKFQKKHERWHAFDAPGIRPTMQYEIFGIIPPKGRHWMYEKSKVDKMIKNGKIRKNKKNSNIQYLLEASDFTLLDSNWTDTQESKSDWNFNNGEKNPELIKRIIKLFDDDNAIFLDSFAGSGTTGHAVLDLNKEDGGNRKFILVEMEKEIARKITAERVRRVARGYAHKNTKGELVKVAGLGGGFEYVQLGAPLFDKNGAINPEVGFEDMARYIFFTETRTNLEKKNIAGNFIGEFGGGKYYLLFDGIGKNILDMKFAQKLKKIDGQKIIYADKCLVSDEFLEECGAVFKQIPYEIKIY